MKLEDKLNGNYEEEKEEGDDGIDLQIDSTSKPMDMTGFEIVGTKINIKEQIVENYEL